LRTATALRQPLAKPFVPGPGPRDRAVAGPIRQFYQNKLLLLVAFLSLILGKHLDGGYFAVPEEKARAEHRRLAGRRQSSEIA
jgi:hypothetical protein